MQRITCLALASLFSLPVLLVACGDDGGHGAEPFPNLQECFDDHTTGGEMLAIPEAIAVCCLDHPLAGVKPSCKDTAVDCEAYVNAQLTDTSATTAEITTACADYIVQKGM